MATMKRLICIFLNILFLSSVTSPLFADSRTRKEHPVQLQVASFVGNGISIGYHFLPKLFLGLESYNMSDSANIMDLEVDYSFTTNQLVGRYFIWDHYGFCIQGGLASREWTIKGQNRSFIGNDSVKRDTTMKIKWPDSAIIFGVGWFLIGKSGISGGFGTGFISGGAPDVTIEASGASAGDIALEEEDTENTIKNYNVFPYTHLSIGWNF